MQRAVGLVDATSALPALGAARSESLHRETLPWLIGLVVLAVAGCVALMLIRRLLQREVEPGESFTLDDLRGLHRSGQLTDEEFARAKARMLGSARATVAKERQRRAARDAQRRRRGDSGPLAQDGDQRPIGDDPDASRPS